MLIPESCDIEPVESTNFDMAPVYGHVGVELSGLGAVGYFDVFGLGNDSERCLLSHSILV